MTKKEFDILVALEAKKEVPATAETQKLEAEGLICDGAITAKGLEAGDFYGGRFWFPPAPRDFGDCKAIGKG